MDMRTCHCRNKRCEECGRMGDESKLRRWGNNGGGEPRLRCDGCRKIHDVREGSAYAGMVAV